MDIQGACNLCNLSFRSIDLSPTVHKTRNDHGSLIKINVGQYKKNGLRTADYRLRTGYKIQTRYKTRTGKYGLGIKDGVGIKRELRTADWVLNKRTR